MKRFSADAEVVELLDQMERRVASLPALAREWREARSGWPGPASDSLQADRFREWFLLERDSAALGAPPLAVWAPLETGEPAADPWTRLLESFFGVFRVAEEADEEGLALSDLWSGRRVVLDAETGDLADGTLLLGRVVPAGEEAFTLLPGWRIERDLALAEALAADLGAARAAQPRARPSQLELERLWHARNGELAAPASQNPAECAAELERLLTAAPGWSLERASAVLEQEGSDGLLDRLAFETRLDLDPIRNLLMELRAQTAAQEPSKDGHISVDEIVDPQEIATALAAFDQERSAGADLRSAMRQLVESLDLADDGADSIEDALLQESEAIGPGQLPGLGFWVDAWAWERSQVGATPTAREVATTREFACFIEGLREEPTDASEIHASDLWAFLAGSQDVAALTARRADLDSFLVWLREEHAVALPLEESSSPTSPSYRRLQARVAWRGARRATPGRRSQVVRIWKTNPPLVQTESAESAPIRGVPDEVRDCLQAGDSLAGRWEAGAFHAEAWFPAEFQPKPSFQHWTEEA
jgi:hypothetical protein